MVDTNASSVAIQNVVADTVRKCLFFPRDDSMFLPQNEGNGVEMTCMVIFLAS